MSLKWLDVNTYFAVSLSLDPEWGGHDHPLLAYPVRFLCDYRDFSILALTVLIGEFAGDVERFAGTEQNGCISARSVELAHLLLLF